MSNPSQSLTCLLDWIAAFKAIGLEDRQRSDLPQFTDCPLCKTGVLSIMRDYVLHSQWFSCQDCQFAGDLIELAAKVMDRSIQHTIEFLESHKLFSRPLTEIDLKNYQEEQVEYRRRLNAFWSTASQAGCRVGVFTSDGYSLLRELGMERNLYFESWAERDGRVFGVSSRTIIEDLFFPLSFEVQERSNRHGKVTQRRGGGPGKQRLFEGRHWDDVLVIPHFDLPGRILGFTCIGGDVEDPQFVYKRANVGCSVTTPRESGLGFLNAIDEMTSPHFGSAAFIFGDPRLVTLLHARRFRDSQRPLPVLLMHQSRDFRVINLPPAMLDRDVILCGPLKETLPLAKAMNAKVSLYQVTDAEVRDRLKHNSPIHWLHLYQKKAVPWVNAFQQQVAKLPQVDLDILLSRMNLTADECRRMVIGSGDYTGGRLARCGPHGIGGKSINVQGKIIAENANGWSIRKASTEEVICNYPIRIETIYKMATGGNVYEVSVHCSSEPVQLIVYAEDLKRHTLFDLIAGELHETDHPRLQYSSIKWAKASFDIALQFSEPQVVHSSGRVGWDSNRFRFQFPSFAILNDGSVDQKPMLIRDTSLGCPAADLIAPIPRREFVTVLSRHSPETQIIWALAACIAHNLLAGNCLREPLGIILDGTYARETGVSAALALGCGDVDLAGRGKAKISEFVLSRCGAHDFPSVVNFGTHSKHRFSTTWLDEPSLRQAVLSLPTSMAIAVSSHEGFVRISVEGDPQPLGRLSLAAKWIIPAYLADLCRRKKQFHAWKADNNLITVLGDMAEWLERAGGTPKAVLAAQQVLNFACRPLAKVFVELVDQLREASQIPTDAVTGEYTAVMSDITLLIDGRAEYVPPIVRVRIDAITDALRQKSLPAINLQGIQEDLVARSAWCGTFIVDGGVGWMIDAFWWRNEIEMIRQKRHRTTSPTADNCLPTDQKQPN